MKYSFHGDTTEDEPPMQNPLSASACTGIVNESSIALRPEIRQIILLDELSDFVVLAILKMRKDFGTRDLSVGIFVVQIIENARHIVLSL
jgi:hypothetical protein